MSFLITNFISLKPSHMIWKTFSYEKVIFILKQFSFSIFPIVEISPKAVDKQLLSVDQTMPHTPPVHQICREETRGRTQVLLYQ